MSTNASSWVTVFSTTNGNGAADDISFTATNARYVRMNGTHRGTQYAYSLWEFEVYASSGSPLQLEPTSQIPFSIAPNPISKGSLKISGATDHSEAVTFQIHDLLGRVIYSKSQTVDNGSITEIPTSLFKKGVYIISARGKRQINQAKFIVE